MKIFELTMHKLKGKDTLHTCIQNKMSWHLRVLQNIRNEHET